MYTEQHEVRTRYGSFLLDGPSYEAYLAGKLWIDWNPRSGTEAKRTPEIPRVENVSPEAVRLRDAAQHKDVYALIQERFPGRNVPVPYKKRMSEWSNHRVYGERGKAYVRTEPASIKSSEKRGTLGNTDQRVP